MDAIEGHFLKYPSQGKVAEIMLRFGICAKDGWAYAGNVEISDSALSKAAGVDRRVVRSALKRMASEPELDNIFSKLRPILLMDEVAPAIGCSAIEIIPTDATMPGILADVASVICEADLSIRQAVVDDVGEKGVPHLIVVVDGHVPPEVAARVRRCRGVSGIIIR